KPQPPHEAVELPRPLLPGGIRPPAERQRRDGGRRESEDQAEEQGRAFAHRFPPGAGSVPVLSRSGSTTSCRALAATEVNVWRTPLGQVISSRSTSVRSPRPKWTTREDCDR